ncbi:MAG: DUF177 domain-containing protein [Chloroflexi bacterium]|nr:DUF177 domain-containing protein [Chloroflexota bacterium]
MINDRPSQLRFNFGFLLEAQLGTNRIIELNYPKVQVSSDVTLTPLTGVFTATRTSEGVYLSGELSSTVPITCVRCLDDNDLPITLQMDDLFYYPPHSVPEGEYAFGEDGFLDLAPLVRELNVLAIPIQPICRPDCQGLCDQCGQNFNEGTCECDADDIDPRLAALKNLLDS